MGPTDRLPSLELIRSFEAAARHLSFTRAAEELCVTQSAVSRSIKSLEEHWGVALFQRRHRALLLTDAGQTLYLAATEALQRLRDANREIRRDRAGRMVTVTSTLSFASLWLIPRLSEFCERHTDIEVRIAATNQISDLERDNIDVAIRYCSPKVVPAGACKLFGEDVFPVCSPRLLQGEHRLERAQDLNHQVLLHLDDPTGQSPWLNWNVWFEVMKVKNVVPSAVLRFSHYDHLVQAALDGQGVALGRNPLMRRLMREGRLVAPIKGSAVSSRAYFVLTAPGAAARPQVQKFVAWLRRQAKSEHD